MSGDRVFVVPESEAVFALAKPDRAALDKALESSLGLLKVGSLDPLKTSSENGIIILSRLELRRNHREPASHFPAK